MSRGNMDGQHRWRISTPCSVGWIARFGPPSGHHPGRKHFLMYSFRFFWNPKCVKYPFISWLKRVMVDVGPPFISNGGEDASLATLLW